MWLALRAWQLRESARAAVAAGDFGQASMLAEEAQNTQRTPAGHALRVLSAWLKSGSVYQR
jgi:hypothetical protein